MKALAMWLLSPLEEKRDGLRRLSATRTAVAAFTIAYVYRLLATDTLGWPDAFLAFCVLFALPISKALDSSAPEAVVQAVTGMFGRGSQVGGGGMYETATQTRWEPPGALAAEDLTAPVGQGRPEPEETP